MARWFRVLIHDGPKKWIRKAKQNSLLPSGVRVKWYGKSGDWSIQQYEGKNIEALASPIIQMAILKEVEQVLSEYDDSALHPADKIRNMLKELSEPKCRTSHETDWAYLIDE